MGGGLEVNQPTRGMPHRHKHVEDSEPSGYYDAEITGDNQPGVIPEKDRPPLIAPRSTARTSACTSGLCAATRADRASAAVRLRSAPRSTRGSRAPFVE
jgi:hypothetical protein